MATPRTRVVIATPTTVDSPDGGLRPATTGERRNDGGFTQRENGETPAIYGGYGGTVNTPPFRIAVGR